MGVDVTDQTYEGDPAERADSLDPADPDRAADDAAPDDDQLAGDPAGDDDPQEVLIDAVLAGEEDDVPEGS